jgi:DNA-binding NarL/FixJ family response regulator
MQTSTSQAGAQVLSHAGNHVGVHPGVQKIRIFLVEDHLIFRQSLAEVLHREKDIEVVGQSSTASEAVALIQESKPSVLLTELRFSGLDGLELLGQLPRISPETRAVVFTESLTERDVLESLRLGARGYAYKKIPTDQIIACIRRVAAGEVWLQTPQLEVLIHALQTRGRNRPMSSAQLSPRERQIIQLVLAGCRNREVAKELGISEKTVKNHLSNIFDKLGVGDRLEMALYVLDKKLLGTEAETA